MCSRDNNDRAELSKVMVKSEGMRDLKLFHHHFAGAICKTPFFVGEASKGFPCQNYVSFGQIINCRYSATEELLAQHNPSSSTILYSGLTSGRLLHDRSLRG